jgi:hypothetical protein
MAEAGIKKGSSLKSRLLIAGIVLLCLLVAAFSFLNRDRTGLKEGTVVIKAGDNTLSSFTVEDLQKLPVIEKKTTIHSSRGSTEHSFTGTPLAAVLSSVDPALTQNYIKVVARGIDGYSSVINMSEVLQPDNVYIVYADSGRPLKTKTGGEGSMQVIISGDEFGQRFTYWLVSLELQ